MINKGMRMEEGTEGMSSSAAESCGSCGSCGSHGGCCGCLHHKVMPVLVILFGATFLSGAFGWLTEATVGVIWPSLIILGGLQKLFARMCKCC